MTPEDKKTWTDALRSGKYQQARGQLKRDDGYCCLGVACVVLGDESNPLWHAKIAVGKDLPTAMAERLGISHAGSLNTPIECYFTLIGLNDSGRYNFNQIADVIDAQF